MILFIGLILVVDGIWSLITIHNRHHPWCPWFVDAGRVFRTILGVILIIAGLILHTKYDVAWAQSNTVPNLWKGLIAEDTSGDYQVYRDIASCVYIRVTRSNLDHGLVALKRNDLSRFIRNEKAYALKTKGIDLEQLAKIAVHEVFTQGVDSVNGADHYEHTGKYPTPKFAKSMKVVKVLYPGTIREITFYKSRRNHGA